MQIIAKFSSRIRDQPHPDGKEVGRTVPNECYEVDQVGREYVHLKGHGWLPRTHNKVAVFRKVQSSHEENGDRA